MFLELEAVRFSLHKDDGTRARSSAGIVVVRTENQVKNIFTLPYSWS